MWLRRAGVLAAISVSVFSIGIPVAKAGSSAHTATPAAAAVLALPLPTGWVGFSTEIVAHRGDVAVAAPNTPASITAGLREGADAVEFDVQETKDHQLVVLHDADLAKNTVNCTGDVNKITYAQYRTCKTSDGKVAPNLFEALKPVRDAGKRVFIHVKTKGGEHLAKQYMKAVNKYGLNRGDHAVFFSDQQDMLAELHAAGAANIGLIFNDKLAARGWASTYPILVPFNTPVTAAQVRTAQARGQMVYPVESHPVSVEQAKALGVDGFLTNDLAHALSVLR
jgi:glycerophosphoryl diester phosphodiesterase